MADSNRKTRIRRHVIADMSLHHVAYHVVKCGFTIEPTKSDYGYDGSIFTYNDQGEIENGNIFVQLKATDHIDRYIKKTTFSYPTIKRDVELWQDEPFPVYIIVFDAIGEVAYWLYLQKYLENNHVTSSTITGASLSVRMDATQVVNMNSVRRWRADKTNVLANIGTISHA